MKDSFLTIASPSYGEFRDRGSKFLAYSFPAESEAEWQNALAKVQKEHPKARHYCYAYRLGTDQNNFRANDDGEPSGTAGRPILGQIDSFGLTNIIVIVVRYFGGTLLGTSGLINAYKKSAKDALGQAQIEERIIEDLIKIQFDYGMMGEVMNAVKKLDMRIIEQHFKDIAYLKVGIRKSNSQNTLIHLKALIAKVSIEEAESMEWHEIDGVEIAYLE